MTIISIRRWWLYDNAAEIRGLSWALAFWRAAWRVRRERAIAGGFWNWAPNFHGNCEQRLPYQGENRFARCLVVDAEVE